MPEGLQMNIDDVLENTDNAQSSNKFTRKSSFRKATIPLFLKKILAFLSSLLLLFFFYWFLSVQYPLEVESYEKRILGFGRSTLSSVQNKSYISLSFFNFGSGTSSSGNTSVPIVTPDPFHDTPTPLAQSLDEQDFPTESIEETVFPLIQEDTFDDTSSNKKLEIQEEFISLKEKAELFLVNSSDTGSSLQLSIARVASNKIDVLLDDSSLDVFSLEKELDQIRTLLKKLDT